MRTMAVVGFVDLLWDIAGVFEQADCLVVVPYGQEAA